ncbi:ABC transporter ATP-binding protein [Streptomyces sp. 110]|uniref:ABC transporter ATP-binding protein n=1 Tax=Streptomyces endocoffeicus TaxID=2898945 RepID=A0ABS1Q0G7_9ACTN|nr:ABC transporter ATP-binding protein [Streptomyces endocoffeicus]MBL1118168.1 ABC transporter ATP-binding protein [Streptomyces endocoffeicus]
MATVRGEQAEQVSSSRSVGVEAMTKVYPGGRRALDGVELAVEPGTFVVLLGPSGCGKTTLLRCIAGLERISAGRVVIGGEDVTHREPGDRGVAMVFQNYALYPTKTVLENIEYPLRMVKVPRQARHRQAREMAELLRLGPVMGSRPAQLSGGQRQRVGIGRALVREPNVLLMDEPLSNIDAELRGELRAEIRRLQRRSSTTTFYVTHDQAEALALADRLVVMRDGRIEQDGPPEQVYQEPATRFVASFLGGMNMLDLTRSQAVLPAQLRATLAEDRLGWLGVRPEDLRVVARPEDATGAELVLHGTVEGNELLGRERLVHFRTRGDQRARVRIHADQTVPAQITVVANSADIHLFDTAGRRLSGTLPLSSGSR